VLPLENTDTAWLAEKEDRIKLISFTGSAKVGWELKAHSGRKRVVLELGGNAALVVHSDWKDLDDAALRTTHMQRSVLPASRASACSACLWSAASFRPSLWKVVEVCGQAGDWRPIQRSDGSGADDPAERSRARGSVGEGGRGRWRQAGGWRRAQGSSDHAHILTATKPGMKVRDEEIFGPVVLIEPYDDFEDALAR
jgi:acyl-CoA reductase-like NAD-dependent aldehyde dehydrogenase